MIVPWLLCPSSTSSGAPTGRSIPASPRTSGGGWHGTDSGRPRGTRVRACPWSWSGSGGFSPGVVRSRKSIGSRRSRARKRRRSCPPPRPEEAAVC